MKPDKPADAKERDRIAEMALERGEACFQSRQLRAMVGGKISRLTTFARPTYLLPSDPGSPSSPSRQRVNLILLTLEYTNHLRPDQPKAL
jgi:hypothetical protein